MGSAPSSLWGLQWKQASSCFLGLPFIHSCSSVGYIVLFQAIGALHMLNVTFSWMADNYFIITVVNYFNSSGWRAHHSPMDLNTSSFQVDPNIASSWWLSLSSSEHTGTHVGLEAGLSVKTKAKTQAFSITWSQVISSTLQQAPTFP